MTGLMHLSDALAKVRARGYVARIADDGRRLHVETQDGLPVLSLMIDAPSQSVSRRDVDWLFALPVKS